MWGKCASLYARSLLKWFGMFCGGLGFSTDQILDCIDPQFSPSTLLLLCDCDQEAIPITRLLWDTVAHP